MLFFLRQPPKKLSKAERERKKREEAERKAREEGTCVYATYVYKSVCACVWTATVYMQKRTPLRVSRGQVCNLSWILLFIR